jgi:hypothetical protein
MSHKGGPLLLIFTKSSVYSDFIVCVRVYQNTVWNDTECEQICGSWARKTDEVPNRSGSVADHSGVGLFPTEGRGSIS